VHRTLKHTYAQVIDDTARKTLASASTMDKDVAGQLKCGGNKDAAAAVGRAVAERAQAAGVKQVCFDRGRFKYHGRVASLADAARAAGLKF
jgi:large subunit ribosomal protein L18